MNNGNHKDQQPQPELQDIPIVIITYTKEKQIKIEFKTNNLMMLSHACRLLNLHLDNAIIMTQQPQNKIINTDHSVHMQSGMLDNLRRFLKK